MPARLLVRTFLVILFFSLWAPPARSEGTNAFSLDGFNAILDRLICPESALEEDSKRCNFSSKAGSKSDRISNYPYHRLLRAQLVLELAARFGAARFPIYSETPEQDAIQLMASIRDTRTHLMDAKAVLMADTAKPEQCARFDLIRTELALSLLKTANYSTKGVKALFSGWSSPKNWILRLTAEHTEDILRGLLEDKLYMNAYQNMLIKSIRLVQANSPMPSEDSWSCTTSMAPQNPATANAMWDATDAAITAQCEKLAKIAGISGGEFCTVAKDGK